MDRVHRLGQQRPVEVLRYRPTLALHKGIAAIYGVCSKMLVCT